MNSEEHFTKSTELFFDTYALVEIFLGNEDYAKFFDSSFFITNLNIFEYHQFLLRISNSEFADSEVEKFNRNIIISPFFYQADE